MKNKLLLSFLSCLIIIFSGCGTMDSAFKENLSQVDYLKAKAKLVKYVTSGRINPVSTIQVIFHKDQVPESNVGKVINRNVFQFSPSINGKTTWETRKKLVLTPTIALPAHQSFKGYLDMMLLFGTNKKKIKRIKLKFSTGGQKILSFDHEFVPDSNSQPLRVRLKGNFHFLNQEKIESLQKIIKLYEGSQQLKIKFYKKDSKNFYFTTNPFTRSHKQRVFDLYVPSTALHIKKAIRKKIYLYSISSLRIASITPLVQKKANRIKIAFSSKLDLSKNYNGFIQVRHKRKNGTYKTVKFKMKTQKEALILTGNFLPGHEYKVSILNGITAKNATKLKKAYTRSVHFLDIKSKIVFQHDGIFLPSSNRRKIYFSTINLSKVRLEVKQVFDQNLGFFLQESRLSSKKGRTDLYNYELNRVGITIHKEILKIGKIKNKWLKSELDLSKIFNKHKSGLFVIILKFRKKDALVDKKLLDWSHMSRHKRILKPVILSDLGLIAKRGNSETTVFVTNLIDTKPVSGVIVKAYSYQNQLLDSKITDQSGICDLKTTKAYYIEASYNKHKAILKFSEMELNKSLFNTGGSSAGKSGIRCFSYTERGVYRPGDNINLSLIVRNNNGSFPENHPVSLKFYNPRNRKVSEIINKKSIDGFYNFNLKTLPDALTGNWEARIQIGDRKFYQTVKIETVVPFKLKVNIYPDKKILLPDDHKISFKVESKYLFGTPASGNNTSSKITIKSIAPVFQNYKTYSFFNEARAFTPVTSPKFEAILSSKGQTNVSWNIPEFKNVPGILKTTIESIVFEKGGRQVLKTRTIPYNFYSLYVGVLKPETLNIKTGDTVKIPFIAVNHDGKPVKGKKLTYRIYKNNHYWWWDYSNQVNFRKHFKSNVDTELVKSGSLTTDVIPVTLKITAENSGEMLIEVQNGEDGHCSSFFFSSHSWGSENRGKDADVIQIKTDSKKYTPGSVATATIKSPSVGMILISIEKAGKILNTKWKAVNKGETKLEIPVTKNMIPTAYLSVMLIQPHAQSKNDRPLRMYGIVPLNVEEKSTHLTFNLETPKSTLPESEFDIRIKTSDGKKAQFTIAIVDEGLLDLTGFRTPAPWKFFFQKESLLIRTFDIFSDVIGANWGEIYKVFSIGGGGWEEDERKRQSPVKVKRFKPVALFKGPIETNEKGEYKTSFKMPNYIGSVKVMVVGARGNSYGKRDAKVLVKSPIMIMPTLPRSLAPEDEFEIPVTFFSMEKNVGKVKIDIETKGPITVIDKTEYNLYCNSIEEKMVYFKCKAGKEVGKAKIIIKATSTAYTSKSNTEIAVRPVNPFTSITTSEILKKGKTINLKIPGEVIKGSSSAKLTVSKYPQMNFDHRLKWLIKYPYGCI
ncbi:hypothetical protein KAJ27_11030, partial [bacterium]|nr:hypothetical protein [bacterium]